ncbi:hypothetical protein [Streptomyces broussonetiae]|uniref:hypothetical protein n=1 Tax=Streptomyces broussonetiae TaxID=2686304 RepID=UPI0035D54895
MAATARKGEGSTEQQSIAPSQQAIEEQTTASESEASVGLSVFAQLMGELPARGHATAATDAESGDRSVSVPVEGATTLSGNDDSWRSARPQSTRASRSEDGVSLINVSRPLAASDQSTRVPASDPSEDSSRSASPDSDFDSDFGYAYESEDEPEQIEAVFTGSSRLEIAEPEGDGLALLHRQRDQSAMLSFSADRTLAVSSDGPFQSAFATMEAVERANAALTSAGSAVRLRLEEEHHVDVPVPRGGGARRLYRVTPQLSGRPDVDSRNLTALAMGGSPNRLVFRDPLGGTATVGIDSTGRLDEVHRLVSALIDSIEFGHPVRSFSDAEWAAEVIRSRGGPDVSELEGPHVAGRGYAAHVKEDTALRGLTERTGGNASALAKVGEGYVTQSIAGSGANSEELAQHDQDFDEARTPYGRHYAAVVLASEDGDSHVTLENVTHSGNRTALLFHAVYKNLDRFPGDRLTALHASTQARVHAADSAEQKEIAEASLEFVTRLIALRSAVDENQRRSAPSALQAEETKAMAAFQALSERMGLPDEGQCWSLRLIRPSAGETFHDLMVRKTWMANAFTAVVAGGPHPITDRPAPLSVGERTAASLAELVQSTTQSIPQGQNSTTHQQHREYAPHIGDVLAYRRINLDKWRILGSIGRARDSDAAAAVSNAAAEGFRARTRRIEDAWKEAQAESMSPVMDSFLESPSAHLLKAWKERQEWRAEVELSIAQLADDQSGYDRTVLRQFGAFLDEQMATIRTELETRDAAGTRELDPRVQWLLSQADLEELDASAEQMFVTAKVLGEDLRQVQLGDTTGPLTDAEDLRRRRDEVLTALHVYSGLDSQEIPWNQIDRRGRLELFAAELRTQELRRHLTKAALHRLAHLNLEWRTGYGFADPEKALVLLQSLHRHLTSPAMTAVTNVDIGRFRTFMEAPDTRLDDLLGVTVNSDTTGEAPLNLVPAALASKQRQNAGAAPHTGIAIHWKHGLRRRALHTPVPTRTAVPDDGAPVPSDFYSGFTLSSLHALVVRGDEAAVRLALAEATDYAHDQELLRERDSGRFHAVHFGADLPGGLGWQDVERVVLPFWDRSTRHEASGLAAELRNFAEQAGLDFSVDYTEVPPPLIPSDPPMPVHTLIETDDTATIGLDYVPLTTRSATALPQLVTDKIFIADPQADDRLPNSTSSQAPWTQISPPEERPFFVRAAMALAPEHTLLQFNNGVIRSLSAREFAARVADDFPPDTVDGPIVLLIAYGGAGHLELARLLAARTGRQVWAFTRNLEVMASDGQARVTVFTGHTGRQDGLWTLSHPGDLRSAALQEPVADAVFTGDGQILPDSFILTTTIPDANTYRPIGRSAHTREFHHRYEQLQQDIPRLAEHVVVSSGNTTGKESPAPTPVNRQLYPVDAHHEDSVGFDVRTPGNEETGISPDEFGGYLRRRRSLGSLRIMLVACDAGSKSGSGPAPAQVVANTIGNKVFAANSSVNVQLGLAPRADGKEAEWLTFTPQPHSSEDPQATPGLAE